MLKIKESGMRFELPAAKTFAIERSRVYQKINPHGVSAVEFITLGPRNDILFVEAKTSAPNEDDLEGLTGFAESIGRKFVHSLEICYALLARALPGNPDESIPDAIKDKLMDKPTIKLILIVNKLNPQHCAPLQDLLRKTLRAEKRIWHMNVIVLNKEMASKKHMIH